VRAAQVQTMFLVTSSTNRLFAFVLHPHHGLRPSLSTELRAEYSPCDGLSSRVPQLSAGPRVRNRLVFRRYIQDLRHHISELLPCCLLQTSWRTSGKVAMFLKTPLEAPGCRGLVCMPIVPATSDREQQIGQDAAENERNSNQELQNRIHHGLPPRDQLDAKTR
jgi:hypothetical protein